MELTHLKKAFGLVLVAQLLRALPPSLTPECGPWDSCGRRKELTHSYTLSSDSQDTHTYVNTKHINKCKKKITLLVYIHSAGFNEDSFLPFNLFFDYIQPG